MNFLAGVFFRTRRPLLSAHAEMIREESKKAHLRSTDRMQSVLKAFIKEHNIARGIEVDDDGQDNT